MLQSGRVFGDRANVVAAKGASDATRVKIGRARRITIESIRGLIARRLATSKPKAA